MNSRALLVDELASIKTKDFMATRYSIFLPLLHCAVIVRKLVAGNGLALTCACLLRRNAIGRHRFLYSHVLHLLHRRNPVLRAQITERPHGQLLATPIGVGGLLCRATCLLKRARAADQVVSRNRHSSLPPQVSQATNACPGTSTMAGFIEMPSNRLANNTVPSMQLASYRSAFAGQAHPLAGHAWREL